MKLHLNYLVALFVVLGGCAKNTEIDQPPYTPRIVVDGYIEQDRPAMVFLTLSSPFLTHYDSASIAKTFLNYAKVEVITSDGEAEVLTLFKYNKLFPPFVYRTTQITGKVGVEYQLKISVKGQTLQAITSIPPPPTLLQVRYNSKNDTTGYLEFLPQLSLTDQQMVFVQIKSVKADKNFHPSANPIITLPIGNSTHYWVRAWRSKEISGYSTTAIKNYYTPGYPRFLFHKSDTVWIKAGNTDSTSFAVLKSMFIDLNQNENPFAFNGNTINTNIEGGIGRWTGIGVAPLQWICGQTKPLQIIH